MTRTNREEHRKSAESSKGTVNEERRRSDISRSTTKILRHQAQKEGIPISTQGWVKINDLLAWKGFRDKRRFTPSVVFEDIFDVVEHDGKYGKGRFALRLVVENEARTGDGSVDADGAATGPLVDATKALDINAASLREEDSSLQTQTIDPTSKNNPETLQILGSFPASPGDASSYMIRATQGHSIEAVESEGLHKSITLDDESMIPEVVVHGTFYGAWESILASGGLKPMGRNMVHFATGPSLSKVMPVSAGNEVKVLKQKEAVDGMLNENKVISGMRWDAQILIYIDLKRCLEDVKAKGLAMEWFKSDNGVILTPGVALSEQGAAVEVDDQVGSQKESRKKVRAPAKVVPTEYWHTVVEIKQGLGVLWKHGEGIVKDLPANLKAKPLPRGKQGLSKGQQKGPKPKLRVERDVVETEDTS